MRATLTILLSLFCFQCFSQCDCYTFPVAPNCKKECGIILLQSGTKEQLKAELKLDDKTIDKIINTPNRENKKSVNDFKTNLQNDYQKVEKAYNNWTTYINIQSTTTGDIVNGDKITIIGDTSKNRSVQNNNNLPSSPSFGNEIKDEKSGLGIIVERCKGDRINQTVTIYFTFTDENSPNKLLRMVVDNISAGTGVAYDTDGNTYALFGVSLGGDSRSGKYSNYIEKQLFTDSRLKASVTFTNILPNVKRLTTIRVPIYVGVSGQYTSWGAITLKDIDINW